MSHIKIHFEDIEDVKIDLELRMVNIKIMHDPFIYRCPSDFYEQMMEERGYVIVHFEE